MSDLGFFDLGVWTHPNVVNVDVEEGGAWVAQTSVEGAVHVFDRFTGDWVWRNEDDAGSVPSGTAVDPEQGMLYVTTNGREFGIRRYGVGAFDLQTGRWIWRQRETDLSGLTASVGRPVGDVGPTPRDGCPGGPLVTRTLVIHCSDRGG